MLDRNEFPVILGGDCSILLGCALALRRRGRYGLLFVDGHADFYQPEANPNGVAVSMDLAFATGHGPALLTDLEGRAPLVNEEDAVAFGFRDMEEQADYGSQPLPETLKAFDLPTMRRMGAVAAATAAVKHLARAELDGFFIHLDADCLRHGTGRRRVEATRSTLSVRALRGLDQGEEPGCAGSNTTDRMSDSGAITFAYLIGHLEVLRVERERCRRRG